MKDIRKSAIARSEASDASKATIADLIKAEDLVLDLTFRLKAIGQWWEIRSSTGDLGDGASNLIDDLKTLRRSQSLASLDTHSETTAPQEICELAQKFDWPIESEPSETSGGTNPLRPLIEQFTEVREIKFGVLRGEFAEDSKKFITEVLVSGKGSVDSKLASFTGHHELVWEKVDRHWVLFQWKALDLEVMRATGPLFRDVLNEAIPDRVARRKLRRSYHQELIEATITTGQTPIFDERYKPFVGAASPHALPSVSVVDFDSDGWDDLFVSARWGPTQLLKNNGDGTFLDVTVSSGLHFSGLVNCAAFVDLDNDGDPDAVIGRALEPVVYLLNEGGKFRNVTESHSNLSSQYMVSGISVADINRDGLLDLYLSTYGPSGVNERLIVDRQDGGTRFLTEQQRKTLSQLNANENGFVDHAGPPNFIVMNRGDGKLELVEDDGQIAQWHHSYQSAWADVDNDGDDDLYIANDFAQDGFLLNETPQGAEQPIFRDGLEATFPGGGTGFGMGASWGDFDNDGDLDLYVSNMYSKAGSRILKTLGEGDPRFEIATRGNFLYENQQGKFVNRAGNAPGQMNVGKVGWSYGGQFFDADNNGHLDVYVPSGYFTAVAAGDTKVDI